MKNGMKVIDIHNHAYTKPWLDYLAQRAEEPNFEWTGAASGVAKVDGVIAGHVDRPGDFDMAARVEDLDNAGIDVQVLSHTCPGVAEVSVHEGIEWSRRINDTLAETCRKWPGRFYFLATLPPKNIEEALKEMERAYSELDTKGIQMYSNIDGVLCSAPEFHPIFEKAAEYSLPVKIHPAFRPLTTAAMKTANLPLQLYGFTLDTTMAVTNMLYGGLFEKFPTLKVIHSHLGGMAPYMMGRTDTAFKRYSKEWDFQVQRLPSETYKDHVYIDTLSGHAPAIKCACEYMGIDHLLFGTDYPHRASGTVGENLAILDVVGFSDEAKEKVFAKNAIKLFNLQ